MLQPRPSSQTQIPAATTVLHHQRGNTLPSIVDSNREFCQLCPWPWEAPSNVSSPNSTLSSLWVKPQSHVRHWCGCELLPREPRLRWQGILLHWKMDLHFLHLVQKLLVLLCVQPCFSLPPFMYRYFIANTLAFTTGFYTLWTTSPSNSFVTFYCQLLLDKNNKKGQVSWASVCAWENL